MATLNIVRNCAAISSLATIFPQNVYRFALRSPVVWASSSIKVAQCKSTNVDALDIFTTHILSKRDSATSKTSSVESSNWSKDKSHLLKRVASEAPIDAKRSINIDNWNQSEIDHHLTVSIDCGDRPTFDEIIEQMLKSKRLPSDVVILSVLCHLCDSNDDSMLVIKRLVDLCQDKNLPFYATNVEFVPFLSQYLWKLERFDDAMHTLNAIYSTTNKTSKRLILRNYRQIVYDAVKNQEECVLNKLIENAAHIYDTHKDPTLINFVWIDCFFSELFRNQMKANELFAIHGVIRETVSNDIGYIALNLLQQHNVDAMHRLIELCLAAQPAQMKREVGVCLTALFDYHCKCVN